jgi:NFU1 iron-sulfur cluster scaffold homolog, mitochondrial
VTPPMIPIHPQSCPDRPDEVRWITPANVLPSPRPSPVATAPDPLAALIDDGTLTEVRIEADALVTRLGHGRSWPRDGPRVRTAVHAALADPAGWLLPAQAAAAQADDAPSADVLLREAAQDLINGATGSLARSHGGTIELVDVHDGIVEVRLLGACHGCPAARTTLRVHLEHQLRKRCPQLREVKAPRTVTDASSIGHVRK